MENRLERVAAELGHECRVENVGTVTYSVQCTCGYRNAQRRRKRAVASGSAALAFRAEAERYVYAHLEQVVRSARVAGRVKVSAGGQLVVRKPAGDVLI